MAAGALSEEDIDKRIPAWCVLSELFLDTELQSTDFDRIAAVLARTGTSVADARRILEEEVAPVFIANALSVAGEWTGWPEAFVKERVLAHLHSGIAERSFANFRARLQRNAYESAWKQVRYRLDKIVR